MQGGCNEQTKDVLKYYMYFALVTVIFCFRCSLRKFDYASYQHLIWFTHRSISSYY